MGELDSGDKLPPRIQWALDLLPRELSQETVEIGCGRGLACAPLLRRSATSLYIGIDRSSVSQARFEDRNHRLVEAGRARFIRADFLGSSVEMEATAGFAVNVNAFWTSPPRAFEAMHRMLRADAVLILVFEAPSEEKAASLCAMLDRSEPDGFVKMGQVAPLDGRTIARRFRRYP